MAEPTQKKAPAPKADKPARPAPSVTVKGNIQTTVKPDGTVIVNALAKEA